ncbi:MAG: hypothetical protein H0V71_03060 [Chloroflexi bacterium]|nr:hypothetical protein [Chloroflexota bacterium]
MTDAQLAIRPSADLWPIWATVGHTAGAWVYWVCHVVGEPGAETTPFVDEPEGQPTSRPGGPNGVPHTGRRERRRLVRSGPARLGPVIMPMTASASALTRSSMRGAR